MLKLSGRKCTVIGGGAVAKKRVRALEETGADIIVIAPQIDEQIKKIPDITCHTREYKKGDLKRSFLVIIATDNMKVNKAAAKEAQKHAALINRADKPDQGDLTIPAFKRYDPLTIAVDTARSSPGGAKQILNELCAALDKDWPKLLKIAGFYRKKILDTAAKTGNYKQKLKDLSGSSMMKLLKKEGEKQVRDKCEQLTK